MNNLRRLTRNLIVRVSIKAIRLRWFLLGPYYAGLAVQAEYLYRQSELYKNRWRVMGQEFADEAFKGDALLFFHHAQHGPWLIKFMIFIDATLGKAPTPYYISDVID